MMKMIQDVAGVDAKPHPHSLLELYHGCKNRLQRSRVLIGNQDDESLTLLLWVEMLTGVYGKSALAGAPDN